MSALALALAGCSSDSNIDSSKSANLNSIQNIVVIYLENRSFDNLFGLFPGANGLGPNGTLPAGVAPQIDAKGHVYTVLPDVINTNLKPAATDNRFPNGQLANAPFKIDQYVPLDQATGDLVHRFYASQEQINGGKNDHFAEVSDAGGLVMGYYDTRKTRLWKFAEDFTLADNFFQAAFGGSFLNHFWLVCACTPTFPNAPAAMISQTVNANGQPDPRGRLPRDPNTGKLLGFDKSVTLDGYAVNTTQPFYKPYAANTPDVNRLPPQTLPTIGDRLSEKGISWAWYAGGYTEALIGNPDPLYQFHHQPFVYFKNYADGTDAKKLHLKDEADLLNDIKDGALPAVSFYKPIGKENEHPGYADVNSGDVKAGQVIDALIASPQWQNMAIIVTYDENGGLWDHVAPPKGDRWGPGNRIPAIVISPYAKRGFVDHTQYDTTSILKLIETRFGLAPLSARDKNATALLNAFAF
ncbi:MAG: acid phosphatase [Candidatus Competibacteraceae bacterium]